MSGREDEMASGGTLYVRDGALWWRGSSEEEVTVMVENARATLVVRDGEMRAPFDADGIEDLECPACEGEGCVYVRKVDSPKHGDVLDGYCGDCGAQLTLDVVLEPRFGNPKLKP